MGVENEYTCFSVKKNDDGSPSFETIATYQLQALIANSPELFLMREPGPYPDPRDSDRDSVWLVNGGKVYRDNDAIEYASPECTTLRELVFVEKAGELIVKEICASYPAPDRLFLLKRTTTAESMFSFSRGTWGSHENYSVSKDLFDDIKKKDSVRSKVYAAHLATRLIYAGSGHLSYTDKSGDPPRFFISPRIHLLDKYISGPTGRGERALVNSKDESHMDGNLSHLRRLHLIAGDMSRSDWSLYLKSGVTALILSYLEVANDLELVALEPTIATNDLLSLGKLASGVFGGNPENARMFAQCVDTQQRLRDAIAKKREVIRERFPECNPVIELWSKALSAVRQAVFGSEGSAYRVFSKRLDWLIKKNAFEARAGEKLERFPLLHDAELIKKLFALDFSYHRLNKNDFYRHLVDAGAAEEMFSLSDAYSFVLEAPQGRAANRVAALRYIRKNGYLPNTMAFDFKSIRIGRNLPSGDAWLEVSFDDTPLPELLLNIESLMKMFRS